MSIRLSGQNAKSFHTGQINLLLHFVCDQDEEDFLFEKGDLNLWAEPAQWVQLLHRNLISLILTFKQTQQPLTSEPDHVNQVCELLRQAQARSLSSRQALDSLPDLPQFSCGAEHARLMLRHQRASLALDVLERLR